MHVPTETLITFESSFMVGIQGWAIAVTCSDPRSTTFNDLPSASKCGLKRLHAHLHPQMRTSAELGFRMQKALLITICNSHEPYVFGIHEKRPRSCRAPSAETEPHYGALTRLYETQKPKKPNCLCPIQSGGPPRSSQPASINATSSD